MFGTVTYKQMPEGNEFQIEEATTLKPRAAKVVQTVGTDNRLMFVSD